MWLERFNIVAISLHPDQPAFRLGQLTRPPLCDWMIFAGTAGAVSSPGCYLAALRLVPMVSMFEMRELLVE